MYNNSVPTSEQTQFVSVIKTSWLILFREVMSFAVIITQRDSWLENSLDYRILTYC